jgi:hypothetical protein
MLVQAANPTSIYTLHHGVMITGPRHVDRKHKQPPKVLSAMITGPGKHKQPPKVLSPMITGPGKHKQPPKVLSAMITGPGKHRQQQHLTGSFNDAATAHIVTRLARQKCKVNRDGRSVTPDALRMKRFNEGTEAARAEIQIIHPSKQSHQVDLNEERHIAEERLAIAAIERSKLREVFLATEKHGLVNVADFSVAFKKLGPCEAYLHYESIKHIFKALDVKSNGAVTFDQFCGVKTTRVYKVLMTSALLNASHARIACAKIASAASNCATDAAQRASFAAAGSLTLAPILDMKFAKELSTGAMCSELRSEMIHLAKVQEFRSGDTVCEEGDVAEGLFFVVNGDLDVVKDGTCMQKLRRRDVFGQTSLSNTEHETAGVVAVTDAKCFMIHFDKLTSMMMRYPEFCDLVCDNASQQRRHITLTLPTPAQSLSTEGANEVEDEVVEDKVVEDEVVDEEVVDEEVVEEEAVEEEVEVEVENEVEEEAIEEEAIEEEATEEKAIEEEDVAEEDVERAGGALELEPYRRNLEQHIREMTQEREQQSRRARELQKIAVQQKMEELRTRTWRKKRIDQQVEIDRQHHRSKGPLKREPKVEKEEKPKLVKLSRSAPVLKQRVQKQPQLAIGIVQKRMQPAPKQPVQKQRALQQLQKRKQRERRGRERQISKEDQEQPLALPKLIVPRAPAYRVDKEHAHKYAHGQEEPHWPQSRRKKHIRVGLPLLGGTSPGETSRTSTKQSVQRGGASCDEARWQRRLVAG